MGDSRLAETVQEPRYPASNIKLAVSPEASNYQGEAS